MNVLVIDIGGTHVKILATFHDDERQAASGPTMTAQQMADTVLSMAEDWAFDVVSIGYRGPVVHGKPVLGPKHLGPGWVVSRHRHGLSRHRPAGRVTQH